MSSWFILLNHTHSKKNQSTFIYMSPVAWWPSLCRSLKKLLCTVTAFWRRATFTPSTQLSTRAWTFTPAPARQEDPVQAASSFIKVRTQEKDNLLALFTLWCPEAWNWWLNTWRKQRDVHSGQPALQKSINHPEDTCLSYCTLAFLFVLLLQAGPSRPSSVHDGIRLFK